jgi:hypothetical protein
MNLNVKLYSAAYIEKISYGWLKLHTNQQLEYVKNNITVN